MRGRFGYVDALRGMAIVAMVLYELSHHGVVIATGLTAHLLREGSRGIDLFFVISGFALAYPALSVLRADGRAGLDLGRYAIRRIARIVPATWIAIACLAIAPGVAALVPHPTYGAFTSALPATGAIFREIFFFEAPPSAPDAFWAVSIAMMWYVLFPALLLLWTKSQRGFLGLGAALVAIGPFLHVLGGISAELPAFMLGIVAADWRVRHFGFARWSLYLAVAAAMLGFALEALLHGPVYGFGRFIGDNVGWQAAAFFLLTGIGHSERAERAFDRAFFATAGSVSFSLALVVEPVTAAARPFIQHLSTLGARLLSRANPAPTGGLTGRISHALAPGTPLADVLEVLFVALSVLVAGLLLYRVVDRAVFERDPRMRLADRLEPLLARLFGLMRTTGILILGNAPEDVRFEASTSAASEFYAPPPRGESPGHASVTKRSGSPQDLEQEMIAAKKRLADRTTAMFADAEYEANRAKGIVTAAPGTAYLSPPPGITDTNVPVYGEARDVWQKPRGSSDSTPPIAPEPIPMPAPIPPSTSHPVVFEARPADEVVTAVVPPFRPAPGAAIAPPAPVRWSNSEPQATPPVPIVTEASPAANSISLSQRLSTSPPSARPRPAGRADPVTPEPFPADPIPADAVAPDAVAPDGVGPDAVAPDPVPFAADAGESLTAESAPAELASNRPASVEPAAIASAADGRPDHAPAPAGSFGLDAETLEAAEPDRTPGRAADAEIGSTPALDTVYEPDVAAAEPPLPAPPSPSPSRPAGPIRFKIGGGPPGTNSSDEKSP